MNARADTRPRWLLPLAGLVIVALVSCGGSSDTDDRGASVTADSSIPGASAPATSMPDTVSTLPGRLVADASIAARTVPPEARELSAEQRSVIDQLGPPDRFTIHFLAERGIDGSEVPIRHETWYHDDAGAAIVFRNGEVFTERRAPAPVAHPALGSSDLRPEQFVAGMSVDHLLAVTGQLGYYAVDEPAVDGEIVALEGLVAGVDAQGVVVFVEAIPITPAPE